MRYLLTLFVLALLGAPALAESISHPPSVFTGKLLTYEQLVALPKEKRMNYLKDMVDLLATMESFNNRYTTAELEGLNRFREQVAMLRQSLSLMPEAQAQESGNVSPAPAAASNLVPVFNGKDWTCGSGAVFDYTMGTCLMARGWLTRSTRYAPSKAWFGAKCPKDTQEISHYVPGHVACIPNANWALISPERREGLKKGGFLSASYLRSLKTQEAQRAAILGEGASEDPASGPPKAAGVIAGGTSAPPIPPQTNSDLPPVKKCEKLTGSDRKTAIDRYSTTAPFQGVDANVCISGGFVSQYASAKKLPGTCKVKDSIVRGPGLKDYKCKSGEALCNPALFCVFPKPPLSQEPLLFCVKKVGDRFNRDITDSCAAQHAKLVAKNGKGQACDPTTYMPPQLEFKKIWVDLVSQTQKLRDVWCGDKDFAKLFCRECEIVNDRIYAMNKAATGSGAPEVRAPTAAEKPATTDY